MSGCWSALVELATAPLSVHSPPQTADAIVILGASVDPDGTLSRALAERVCAGVQLYHRGLAPVVCMTGGVREGGVEADLMVVRALELGLPEHALLADRTAVNTRENALRVSELLFPAARVWIVTQPFHLRRSLREFRAAGLRPLGWLIPESAQRWGPKKAAYWVGREYLALLRSRLPR